MIKIQLPLLKTSKFVELSVSTNTMLLENRIYSFLIKTPHPIIVDKTKALFDSDEKILQVFLEPDYCFRIPTEIENKKDLIKKKIKIEAEFLEEIY